MRIKKMKLSGVSTEAEQSYESEHRKIARMAAAEGFVLLKNENQVLPLAAGAKVALYGAGAAHIVKGGSGSGDVNARSVVEIYQGLTEAGYIVTTEKWIAEYDRLYQRIRAAWKHEIWEKADQLEKEGVPGGIFEAYTQTPFVLPAGTVPKKTSADIAIYVLSRTAGEGADRRNQEGDYQISDEERQILKVICQEYPHVIVLINAGGLVDLSFLDQYPNIEGLLYIVQPGMEAGHAVADVLSGRITPSGKLTDSWAYHYEDYPSSASFSHNDGNVEKERYEEGIYVGYRYFDTFQIPVRYSFGYGISYTEFSVKTVGIENVSRKKGHPEIEIRVQVRNIGNHYAGREVVQAYVSCPQGKLLKEYRRLVGFQKTKLLAPGEMEEIMLRFPMEMAASYTEQLPGWILEKGTYGIFVGNSLDSSGFCGSVELADEITLERTQTVCPLKEFIQEISPDRVKLQARRISWNIKEFPVILLHKSDIDEKAADYGTGKDTVSAKASEFVETLSIEQMIALVVGELGAGASGNLGNSGLDVPGSAAQTSSCAKEQGVASIVLADGPAGLRLSRWYPVKDGRAESIPFEMSLEDGFLCRKAIPVSGEIRYQYCTAFPVGTLLAQTWDSQILYQVGQAVADEMERFQISLWLAPGMNIHRNPLCGRNFEYYSEDHFLTGMMAAAVVKGVQSKHGCGVTIKHFACNNQEDNRKGTDSILSERTLREIYLKGFEIAVKQAQPMAIMTSYNKINGVYTANSKDLCTTVARCEWSFKGVIMTDWTATLDNPQCTAAGCMRAGNDLVMPGSIQDCNNMRRELKEGTLSIEELKRSVCHLADVIFRSNRYEEEIEKG